MEVKSTRVRLEGICCEVGGREDGTGRGRGGEAGRMCAPCEKSPDSDPSSPPTPTGGMKVEGGMAACAVVSGAVATAAAAAAAAAAVRARLGGGDGEWWGNGGGTMIGRPVRL